MQYDDTSSTSGSPEPLDFSTSSQFSQHEEIPSKGYSRLFKAQRYGKWHVLKGLKPEHWADPLYMARLEKEFATAVTLDHLNIVHTYSLENDPVAGRCIVMEYIDGRTLAQFLKENPSKTKRKRVALQLLDAMEYYHAKQITHRDLKPSNILITANGDNVKLIDFGLADTDDYAVLKGPAYTKAYAAPEQLRGCVADFKSDTTEKTTAADCRTDIYTFGVLLREIFPHKYRSIARRCTRYKTDERYQTAADIRKAIRHHDAIARWLVPLCAALLVVAAIAAILYDNRPESASIEITSAPVVKVTDTTQSIQRTPIIQTTPTIPATQQTPTDHPTTSDNKALIADTKSAVQRYADSLYKEWRANIDNGTYDYHEKAIHGKTYYMWRIIERIYSLVDKIPNKSHEEYNQCLMAVWWPVKDFEHKSDKYISEKNLPNVDGFPPELGVLIDSTVAASQRVGKLMHECEQNVENRSR